VKEIDISNPPLSRQGNAFRLAELDKEWVTNSYHIDAPQQVLSTQIVEQNPFRIFLGIYLNDSSNFGKINIDKLFLESPFKAGQLLNTTNEKAEFWIESHKALTTSAWFALSTNAGINLCLVIMEVIYRGYEHCGIKLWRGTECKSLSGGGIIKADGDRFTDMSADQYTDSSD
jgi:hypothetical protein